MAKQRGVGAVVTQILSSDGNSDGSQTRQEIAVRARHRLKRTHLGRISETHATTATVYTQQQDDGVAFRLIAPPVGPTAEPQPKYRVRVRVKVSIRREMRLGEMRLGEMLPNQDDITARYTYCKAP